MLAALSGVSCVLLSLRRRLLPWGSGRLSAAVVVVGVSSAAALPRVALSLREALPWGSSRLHVTMVVGAASSFANIPRFARGLGCAFNRALARRVNSLSAKYCAVLCALLMGVQRLHPHIVGRMLAPCAMPLPADGQWLVFSVSLASCRLGRYPLGLSGAYCCLVRGGASVAS